MWRFLAALLLLGSPALAQGNATAYEALRVVARQSGRGVLNHIDRKSTRLNSSHSQISYAVFCLKNKSLCTQRLLSQRSRRSCSPNRHGFAWTPSSRSSATPIASSPIDSSQLTSPSTVTMLCATL